jgi:glycerol kinase
MTHILAIDQGTTSSRAILFDDKMAVAHVAQQEFRQIYPQSGWVEHDVEEIWDSVVAVCRDVVAKSSDIAAIGITNQRETTIVWNRDTGKPIHNAIVWQDRRTAAFCEDLKAEGFESEITHRTGLLADPYFSGTKLRYILQAVEGAQEMADAGKLAFGTVDSFLIWRLTDGKRHVTDATNAARTMLYNIRKGC